VVLTVDGGTLNVAAFDNAVGLVTLLVLQLVLVLKYLFTVLLM
jgi:hypothetical protein